MNIEQLVETFDITPEKVALGDQALEMLKEQLEIFDLEPTKEVIYALFLSLVLKEQLGQGYEELLTASLVTVIRSEQ